MSIIASPRLFARFIRHAGPAIASVSALILAWETYAQLSGISPTTLPDRLFFYISVTNDRRFKECLDLE